MKIRRFTSSQDDGVYAWFHQTNQVWKGEFYDAPDTARPEVIMEYDQLHDVQVKRETS